MLENEGVFASIDFMEPIHVELSYKKTNLADEGLELAMAEVCREYFFSKDLNVNNFKLFAVVDPAHGFRLVLA